MRIGWLILYSRSKKRTREYLKRRGCPLSPPCQPQHLRVIAIERIDHIVLEATLESERVKVMIDSGANKSYISTRVGGLLKEKRRKKEKPYPLILADGTPTAYEGG